MNPAIDQIITWIETEMMKYDPLTGRMNSGFRALEQTRCEALKIKEQSDVEVARCNAVVDDIIKQYPSN